ncbi:alpha/beta hydrolase fold domain-containing protein, partial [Streptomyces sp. MC1]
VLRDEGEAYAARLRQAGVAATNARFGGIVHDFVMVNALHDTEAAKHAVLLATASLKEALHTTA